MHLRINNIEKNLKNISVGYVVTMGILCLFLGFTIAYYTKLHAEKDSLTQAPGRQLEDVIVLLQESEDKKRDLEKQLASLRKTVRKLQLSKAPTIAQPQLEKIYEIAGLSELKGKGVKVVLDDTKITYVPNADNDALVHADYILKIVNDLKSAGAKAISVNNQRIITTSEVVQSGSSVMVNQTRLASPYTILAIGDPEELKIALSFRGSIIEVLKFYGIDVKVEIPPKPITILPYTGKL